MTHGKVFPAVGSSLSSAGRQGDSCFKQFLPPNVGRFRNMDDVIKKQKGFEIARDAMLVDSCDAVAMHLNTKSSERLTLAMVALDSRVFSVKTN